MTPRYDFKCPKCDATEEHSFSIHEDHKPLCADCGVLMAKQITEATPAHFKGRGWAGRS